MGGFELVEHTADVGVIATGATLAEALAWVAKGMFSVIVNLDKVEPREQIEVSVESADTHALVVDWLNELVYRHEAEGFVPCEFRVTVGDDRASLTATCEGEPVDPMRHGPLDVVKAATYHKLDVSHDDEWRIRVFLDV